MNVLLLNGSPHQPSTTLEMARAFLSGLVPDAAEGQITCISSYEKHIRWCLGDLSCWFRQDGRCIIEDDDMNDILDLMKKSNVIVWSFPLFCHGMPASLKAIWDRTIAFLKINMIDQSSYIEHGRTFDLTAKKHVFIIGGGYPYYPGNFAAVKQLARTYLKNPVMICLCQTALLGSPSPETAPLKEGLASLLKAAGEEYGRKGCLSGETISRLEAPLIPNDQYLAMINSLAPENQG